MEKLQAALDKARRERQGLEPSAPAAGQTRRQPERSKVSVKAEDRWAALPIVHLDEENLIQNRVVSYSVSTEAMPIDMLRTKVQLVMRQNGWKRVAITSAEKEAGKTTLACNLALSISRQPGTRSMLLDLDMRLPSVARVLGQKAEVGIEAVLSGKVPLDQHLKCFLGNLAVSMSEDRVFDPMRYVMGTQLEDLLDALQNDYEPDLMLFDLPPLLSVDETRAILKNVDCAIIVARADKTRIKSLDQCERILAEQCNVLGVVINACHYVNGQTFYGEGHY